MGEFLFKIQETFEFEKIGLVVTGDIKTKDPRLSNGDAIELRLPDGSTLTTKVESIPMIRPNDPEKPFSFLLPEGINKEDVPIGTEVRSHP